MVRNKQKEEEKYETVTCIRCGGSGMESVINNRVCPLCHGKRTIKVLK